MSVFDNIAGILATFFQVGGPNGPGLEDNAGSLEARAAGPGALVNVRGAAAVGSTDLATIAQSPVLVFQPGGTASANVYTTWATLYAALNVYAPASANGTRPTSTIQVDDSFTSPAVVPAGAYNLDSVHFTSVANFTTNSNGAALNLAAGVTVTAGSLFFEGAVNVTFLGAAACVTVSGATQQFNLYIEEGAALLCSGAGVFLSCTNGLCIVQAKGAINIGDTVHNVISGTGTGTVVVQAYTATALNADATIGAGVLILWDTKAPATQGAGVTVLPQVLGYIPATPANWDPVPSATNTALDALASRAGQAFQFAAFASLTTAAEQAIPPGSGATTSTADVVLGAIAAKAGFISQMAIQHTGAAGNVAGQTITYRVIKNGAAVAGASIAGIATTAGVKTSQLTFTAVAFAAGDVIGLELLPSALLTTALSDVMASVQ
jgi:hypothetical protein